MNRSVWIFTLVLGLGLGYLIGNFVPLRRAASLESGNHCCDGIGITAKCEKQTGICPADKPIVVIVP
jgi:hypothetical protein